jgi:imidazolonepropionase-like amidohydrolase
MSLTNFLIRNVSILDGTGLPPVRNAAIVIEGEKLAWIGPAENAPSFDPEHIIEGGGGYALPGLINCHVHLGNDAAVDLFQQVANDSVPMATVRAVLGAALTLKAGVTTVRDCGAANGVVIELRKAVDAGLIPGPRIKAAGRVITMTGGHGYFIGREADGPDDVRKATRTEIKGGADFVKVMATGGVLTPGVDPNQTALQFDELQVVAQESHNAGKRTASHAIGNAGIKNALRAGIDSIEHGFYLDDEAIELALKNDAYLVPTLIALVQEIDNGEAGGLPDYVVRKAKSLSGKQRESFKAAVDSGLKIAAGTDAGTPFNPHGDMSLELALMVEYGLSPMQVIVAATRNAADNLDMLHAIGTLEVGKLADVVVFKDDPLVDIGSLRSPRFVCKGGVIHLNDLQVPATEIASSQRR